MEGKRDRERRKDACYIIKKKLILLACPNRCLPSGYIMLLLLACVPGCRLTLANAKRKFWR